MSPSTKTFENRYRNAAIVTRLIFNHCATAHWCAMNGLQVWCRSLEKDNRAMEDMNPWSTVQCALLIVKKIMVCLSIFSGCREIWKRLKIVVSGVEGKVEPHILAPPTCSACHKGGSTCISSHASENAGAVGFTWQFHGHTAVESCSKHGPALVSCVEHSYQGMVLNKWQQYCQHLHGAGLSSQS